MDIYIPEQYNELIERLNPLIKNYDIDEIALNGLVRGCVHIEEELAQPVTRLYKRKDGTMFTTKVSNIKVDLKFALSNAFRMKAIFSFKEVWLTLAIIYLIVDLFTDATKEVDEDMSVVLLAVYRLQKSNLDDILVYIDSNIDVGKKYQKDIIEKALDKLEDFKCIKLIEDRYILNESVASSMFS